MVNLLGRRAPIWLPSALIALGASKPSVDCGIHAPDPPLSWKRRVICGLRLVLSMPRPQASRRALNEAPGGRAMLKLLFQRLHNQLLRRQLGIGGREGIGVGKKSKHLLRLSGAPTRLVVSSTPLFKILEAGPTQSPLSRAVLLPNFTFERDEPELMQLDLPVLEVNLLKAAPAHAGRDIRRSSISPLRIPSGLRYINGARKRCPAVYQSARRLSGSVTHVSRSTVGSPSLRSGRANRPRWTQDGAAATASEGGQLHPWPPSGTITTRRALQADFLSGYPVDYDSRVLNNRQVISQCISRP